MEEVDLIKKLSDSFAKKDFLAVGKRCSFLLCNEFCEFFWVPMVPIFDRKTTGLLTTGLLTSGFVC